jgi:hypothetical protein
LKSSPHTDSEARPYKARIRRNQQTANRERDYQGDFSAFPCVLCVTANWIVFREGFWRVG